MKVIKDKKLNGGEVTSLVPETPEEHEEAIRLIREGKAGLVGLWTDDPERLARARERRRQRLEREKAAGDGDEEGTLTSSKSGPENP